MSPSPRTDRLAPLGRMVPRGDRRNLRSSATALKGTRHARFRQGLKTEEHMNVVNYLRTPAQPLPNSLKIRSSDDCRLGAGAPRPRGLARRRRTAAALPISPLISPMPMRCGAERTKVTQARRRNYPGVRGDRIRHQGPGPGRGKQPRGDPNWTAVGARAVSAYGKTPTPSRRGDKPCAVAIDAKDGKVTRLSSEASVTGFRVERQDLGLAHRDFKHPTDLFAGDTLGQGTEPSDHFNAARLAKTQIRSATPVFTFKGWHGDTVQGS